MSRASWLIGNMSPIPGIAAACTIPSAQALVAQIFSDPKRQALALSGWGASGSLGFVYAIHLS